MPSNVLPPAWESSLTKWLAELRLQGKTEKTIDLRRRHLRSLASLSHTAHPRAVTPEMLAAICRRQDWSFEYRCGVRTSLAGFYSWAIAEGLVTQNPLDDLPAGMIDPAQEMAAAQRLIQRIQGHVEDAEDCKLRIELLSVIGRYQNQEGS